MLRRRKFDWDGEAARRAIEHDHHPPNPASLERMGARIADIDAYDHLPPRLRELCREAPDGCATWAYGKLRQGTPADLIAAHIVGRLAELRRERQQQALAAGRSGRRRL